MMFYQTPPGPWFRLIQTAEGSISNVVLLDNHSSQSTITHEIMHLYGLTDLYGTSTGPGRLSLMASNQINLLTYGVDANPEFNLTKRDDDGNKTPYIDDKEISKIINTAHPLVFGDILMDYLKLLEKAFLNHNHNHLGLSTPIQANPVISTFITEAPKLREKMLSKNIKIN
jgi:hypothetical protein